ncbi:MAG: hypothetical protein GX864_00140 [Mollicutes bacterium]|nr:hypothetical protein [Mollicutes bacterium]
MKKRRSNKRSNRRILLLLVMTLFLMGLGATSTYAWFTANKTITVNPIQVNVETQGGIQISVDARTWKSQIGPTDLNNAAAYYTDHTNQIPATLEAVSSGLAVDTSGRLEMFYGVVDTTGTDHILTATRDIEVRGTTGRFVAFDVFIKADSTSQLYLTTNSGVSVPADQPNDTGIKNATRVAFVETGFSANLGLAHTAYQALNNGTGSTVYLWEPNYDVHTATAIAHADSVYGLTIPATGGAVVPYSGVKAAILSTDNVNAAVLGTTTHATAYPSFFNAISPTYSTPLAFTGGSTPQQVFTVQEGVTKMRWYMWIEGQDVDCENSASGGYAVFNVQLTSEGPTP